MAGKRVYSYQRFSSGSQAEGTSIERQDEEFIKYYRDELEPNGWVFDGSFVFRDKGVSSLHGKHRTKGKLGVFLALCEAGKIPKGSQLVVENFDRLSRECYTDQQALLNDVVVTHELGLKFLNPPMRLITKELLNSDEGEGVIYQLVGEMRRANRESKRKSELIHKAYKLKRQRIFDGEQIKMSSFQAPWLKPIQKAIGTNKTITTGFTIIRWKAAIVKKIFNLRKSGLGMVRIVAKLRDDKVKFISDRQKTWGKSYIERILHDRSVIGEYQCNRTKVVDGKRKLEPVGEPVVDYFPRIITNDLFYAVQAKMDKANKGSATGGRINDPSQYLFRGKLICGYTGEHMVLKSTGKQTLADGTVHHYKYWRAYQAMMRGAVKYTNSWENSAFESWMVHNLTHLDFALIQGATDESEKESLEVKILSARAEKDDWSKKIDNWAVAIGKDDSVSDVFLPLISDAKEKREELDNQINQLKAQLSNDESISGGFSFGKLAEFRKSAESNAKGGDKQTRLRFISQIDEKIDRIEIYGYGWNWTPQTFELALPWVEPETIAKYRDVNNGKLPEFESKRYAKHTTIRSKSKPFVVIYWRNGKTSVCSDTGGYTGPLPKRAVIHYHEVYGHELSVDPMEPCNTHPFNARHYGSVIESVISHDGNEFLEAKFNELQNVRRKPNTTPKPTPYYDVWRIRSGGLGPTKWAKTLLELKSEEGEQTYLETLALIKIQNPKGYDKLIKILSNKAKVKNLTPKKPTKPKRKK